MLQFGLTAIPTKGDGKMITSRPEQKAWVRRKGAVRALFSTYIYGVEAWQKRGRERGSRGVRRMGARAQSICTQEWNRDGRLMMVPPLCVGVCCVFVRLCACAFQSVSGAVYVYVPVLVPVPVSVCIYVGATPVQSGASSRVESATASLNPSREVSAGDMRTRAHTRAHARTAWRTQGLEECGALDCRPKAKPSNTTAPAWDH